VSSTGAGRLRVGQICWSQLTHRGSNNGHSAGSSRVADQDTGKKAELGIFDVHTDTQGDHLCGGT